MSAQFSWAGNENLDAEIIAEIKKFYKKLYVAFENEKKRIQLYNVYKSCYLLPFETKFTEGIDYILEENHNQISIVSDN